MRLIDADALKEALDEQMNNFEENCRDSVFDIINNVPTIEGEILTEEAYSDLCLRASKLRPKGEWNYIQAGMCVCQFCGAMPHKEYKNFCAKCGAKMEAKNEID